MRTRLLNFIKTIVVIPIAAALFMQPMLTLAQSAGTDD
jgi:hypothetical protein